MIPGFREFEFNLPQALLIKLVDAFDTMEGVALTPANVASIPEAQGVYQLSLNGLITYIGKTDAESGLRKRLDRHAWTIQHRKNLDPADVHFKALRVFVFTAIDLETQLIRHYRTLGPVSWNFSGFGSNDPGRERDTTNAKPEGFDALYPVDLERQVNVIPDSPLSAAAVLATIRSQLPYTLRVEAATRGRKTPHPEIESTEVLLSSSTLTVQSVLSTVVEQLPEGWQCTLLAGRIILYKENRVYPFGTVIAKS